MRIKSILAKQKYIYSTHKRPRKLAVKMPFKITSTRYVDLNGSSWFRTILFSLWITKHHNATGIKMYYYNYWKNMT